MENDRDLLEHIYHSYRKQMVALAMSILHDPHDAEDVVSAVLLRVASKEIKTINRIHSETDLRNYLLKTVKNAALNMQHRKKKENVSIDDVEPAANPSDDAFLDMICDKIECQKVVDAIHSLDETYRLALYYHFVMELSVPETAKLLGQSFAATKKQLQRGKKKLLALLGVKGGMKHEDQ